MVSRKPPRESVMAPNKGFGQKRMFNFLRDYYASAMEDPYSTERFKRFETGLRDEISSSFNEGKRQLGEEVSPLSGAYQRGVQGLQGQLSSSGQQSLRDFIATFYNESADSINSIYGIRKAKFDQEAQIRAAQQAGQPGTDYIGMATSIASLFV